MSEWPKVLPGDDGIRPAGPQDACLYCRQKIGQEHGRDCVTITKKVRVRYSFELEIEVPHSWDKGQIEFVRGESSWCANNSFDELSAAFGGDNCACGSFKCDVLDARVDADPIQAPPKDPDHA